MSCPHCKPLLDGEPHIAAEGHRAYMAGEYAQAMKILLPLAEAGDAAAQCNVASMHHLGLGVAVDGAKAEHWYLSACEQNCPLSHHNLATLYYTGGDGVEGKRYLATAYGRKAIELGCDVVTKDFW